MKMNGTTHATYICYDPITNKVLATVRISNSIKNLEKNIGHSHIEEIKDDAEIHKHKKYHLRKFYACGAKPLGILSMVKKLWR